MKCENALDYLERHRFGRPQTLKEISLSTGKSEFSVIRELNSLLLQGRVKVVTVLFNGKAVPFYTVRDGVMISGTQEGRPRRWSI